MRKSTTGPHDNFYYLFAALLVFTVVGPVLTVSLGDLGLAVADLSLSATLVIALWSLHASSTAFRGGIALVVVNLLTSVGWFPLGSGTADLLSKASGLAFLVLVGVVAAIQVFRRDRVDLNKVVGALCIYLLIGAIWAILFQLLDDVSPGSFSGLDGYEGHALSWRFIYFSFVTLTTLGYGDVLPLTIYAETLVFLEAVLGQFYLAVLLAGLISAYLSDHDRHSSP